MTPVDEVALRARLDPERLALVDLETGRRFSYAELDDNVARCASVLRGRGVCAGERVASISQNSATLALLHLACTRVGAIYTPLNVRLAQPELRALLEHAAPRLVVEDERLSSVPLSESHLTPRQLEREIAAAERHVAARIDRDRPSLMLFTSGTTGKPKGALLSERNLGESALNFALLNRVGRDSVFLCDVPLFHVIGLVGNVRTALTLGGCVLISAGFEPARTLARLADPELGVSHYFCVPQMVAALRAQPSYRPEALARLTAIFTGGAPHPAAAVRGLLQAGLTVADGYGMTEAGTVFGMPLSRSVIDAHAGSVGLSTHRVETRIVDDAGNDCPVGTPGELWIRGESVFLGYHADPEGTRAAFADGFFRTGDICKVDAEGFHFLVDRKKDMFISGGENVYPAEVEARLVGFPGLREVAVVGVPDARWGEVGHLAYVAVSGAVVSPEAILEHLRAELGRFKVPKYVTELSALPRTASGKLQRHLLARTLTPLSVDDAAR